MISRLALTFLLLTGVKLSNAQSVSTQMGSRSAALGYASVTLADDWALFNNVAGMAASTETTLGVAYELRPMLPGASRAAAAFSNPIGIGTLGAGFFRFGDDLYSEQIVSVGYSNRFGIASLGAKVEYIQYRAEGFGTSWAVGITFGGIAEITPTIAVGASIQNLNQPVIGPDDEPLPTIMAAGIRFVPSQKLILVAEAIKDIQFKPTIRFGLEYEMTKSLFIRTGFNMMPNAGFGGVGYKAKRLKVDYAFQFSNGINASHQLSTGWQFTTSRN
jgi:hypothetical protein